MIKQESMSQGICDLEALRAENKLLKSSLIESDEKYRILYDDSSSIYFTVEANGTVISVNSYGAKQLGYGRDELVSKSILNVIFPEDRNAALEQLKKCLQNPEQSSTWELRKVHKKGRVLWLRNSARVIRQADGNSIILVSCEDISDRKEFEGDFSGASNNLEKRIENRTDDLLKSDEFLLQNVSGFKRKEDTLKISEKTLSQYIDQLSRKIRYERIISTVTRSVHKTLNIKEVLENAVESMHLNIYGTDNVSIYLVEGNEAVLKSYRGYPDWFIERMSRITFPRDFTWKAIIGGKPSYVADVDKDKGIGPAVRELGTKSYLAMPIFLEEKVLGVIHINSLRKYAFNEEDLKLLEIVAHQIEVAIKNAQQAEALKKSKEALKEKLKQLSKKNRYEIIINTVTRSVHQSIDLQDVLENAVEAMSKNIDGVLHVKPLG